MMRSPASRGVRLGVFLLSSAGLCLAEPVLAGVASPSYQCTRSGTAGDAALIPYFEVDLSNSLVKDTFIGMRRYLDHSGTPALYRVTLWTDFAIPTVSFDVVVNQTKEIGLGLMLGAGLLPNSDADRAAAAASYTGCNSYPPPASLALDVLASAQKRHRGISDGGSCHGKAYGDGVARGYITIVPVHACSPTSLGGTDSPADPTFYGSKMGGEQIFADYFYASQTALVATSFAGVNLVADVSTSPTLFTKFSGGTDDLRIFPWEWQARFFSGLAFDGGTDLIVWRDPGEVSPAAVTCGSQPSWAPLAASFSVMSENGSQTASGSTNAFPLATQRVPVQQVFSPATIEAGDIYLNLFDGGSHTFFQFGHVMSAMTASGRYGVALEAFPPAFYCPFPSSGPI
ncbi:MAG: hypothetical protein U0X73_00540 [Thermoanaerobaculia bacterium]